MAKDLFYSLDLNLLKTFLVLSQELNMRKASERLFVSQPAISQSLQKLRNHFSDPLFVKVPKGLKATPYAEELAENITPLLDSLANTLNASSVFLPENVNRTIKIALSPQVLCTVSGVLMRKLREQAPNLDIHLLNWSASTLDDIRKGKIDIGLNYNYPIVPKELQTKKLIEVEGTVLVRKDHPITLTSATPHDFAGFEIASLIIPGWNDNNSVAADIMDKLGLPHKIGFRSEFPMALIDVIQHTNMYFPTFSLFPINDYPLLRSINMVVDGKKYMESLVSYYHKKDGQSALINWLNTEMQAIFQLHDNAISYDK